MALIGDLFVKVCFTDQWLPMIRSLQILSIAGVILAVVRVIDQYFKAVGLPNVMFYQAVLETIFVFVLIFPLTKIFGVEGVAITVCLAGASHFMMAMHYSIKKLQISYLELAGTILPSITGAIGMSIAVLLVKHSFLFNNALSLIVSVITGALVYMIIMVGYVKIANTGTLKQLQMVKEVYVNNRSA
jgi:PST family polysaccharide transporter/lipopolysaccharide exporter